MPKDRTSIFKAKYLATYYSNCHEARPSPAFPAHSTVRVRDHTWPEPASRGLGALCLSEAAALRVGVAVYVGHQVDGDAEHVRLQVDIGIHQEVAEVLGLAIPYGLSGLDESYGKLASSQARRLKGESLTQSWDKVQRRECCVGFPSWIQPKNFFVPPEDMGE